LACFVNDDPTLGRFAIASFKKERLRVAGASFSLAECPPVSQPNRSHITAKHSVELLLCLAIFTTHLQRTCTVDSFATVTACKPQRQYLKVCAYTNVNDMSKNHLFDYYC